MTPGSGDAAVGLGNTDELDTDGAGAEGLGAEGLGAEGLGAVTGSTTRTAGRNRASGGFTSWIGVGGNTGSCAIIGRGEARNGAGGAGAAERGLTACMGTGGGAEALGRGGPKTLVRPGVAGTETAA